MTLRWWRIKAGLYHSDAFDTDMNRVPYRYSIRRVQPTGWWQLCVEDVHHSVDVRLATVKAAAAQHCREARLLH